MFEVFGIDLLDLGEMVAPYITQVGGLGGVLWKFNRDKNTMRKEFDEKYIKLKEINQKKYEHKEQRRKDHEARVRAYDSKIHDYAEKEMRAVKDIAYRSCYASVDTLLINGETHVNRVVDDDTLSLELDKAMVRFKVALGSTLTASIKTMCDFITFDIMTSYDSKVYAEAVSEKIEDITRDWLNTLKITGIVTIYEEALSVAINEHVQRSVERVMTWALRASNNDSPSEIIAEYESHTLRIERIEETIEDTIAPVGDNPFFE